LIDFEQLIHHKHIDFPDIFIVAGDLGDKADPLAIQNVWRTLTTIAATIPSTDIYGSVGNHDIDTRHKSNKFDPKGFLRTLDPGFPFVFDPTKTNTILEYWANNFTIIESTNYRLLSINSCAFHGYGPEGEEELNHGRISDITLNEIEIALSKAVPSAPHKHNICLFHHHIRPISTDFFDDSSTMKGSEKLVQILSKHELGDWLIIHGHRHRSELFCPGGNTAPIVLSCASFAATRANDEHNPSPNQFYEISMDDAAIGTRARTLGIIKTWSWAPGIGWQSRQSIPGGLPIQTGFGFRGHIPDLAEEIARVITPVARLSWCELRRAIPKVSSLMPIDRDALISSLQAHDIIASIANDEIKELVVKK